MTRVRLDLFTSLDGRVPDAPSSENPMGTDWGRLTKGWASTQTFHERILGDTSGKARLGSDDLQIDLEMLADLQEGDGDTGVLHRLVRGLTCEQQWQSDVFGHVQGRQQARPLEHHPDLRGPAPADVA